MKANNDDRYTLDAIAKKLGITKERVRQIEKQALKKLKNPKFSKKLQEYVYGL